MHRPLPTFIFLDIFVDISMFIQGDGSEPVQGSKTIKHVPILLTEYKFRVKNVQIEAYIVRLDI